MLGAGSEINGVVCRFMTHSPTSCASCIGGTVRNLVCGAIVTPMEGAYGNQEGHPGRFAGGA
jgi:hypothetical protein